MVEILDFFIPAKGVSVYRAIFGYPLRCSTCCRSQRNAAPSPRNMYLFEGPHCSRQALWSVEMRTRVGPTDCNSAPSAEHFTLANNEHTHIVLSTYAQTHAHKHTRHTHAYYIVFGLFFHFFRVISQRITIHFGSTCTGNAHHVARCPPHTLTNLKAHH
jgi:hypothetical protein